MPKLHIYKSEKETCHAFAAWLAELADETLKKQDRFTVALSGGQTPTLLYKILATEYTSKINWDRVHIFWGDERLVSYSDEKNNAATALKMLIDHVTVPKNHVHVIQTNLAPEECAKQYDNLLHSYFEDNETTFDLAILGIGERGNLLSIFPDAEENNYRDQWVMPVYDKQEDLYKITLTIPAINAASVKAFLVTGKRKEGVVQQVLKGKYDPEKYPAQLIISGEKPVHWFLDEGAAGKLIRPAS